MITPLKGFSTTKEGKLNDLCYNVVTLLSSNSTGKFVEIVIVPTDTLDKDTTFYVDIDKIDITLDYFYTSLTNRRYITVTKEEYVKFLADYFPEFREWYPEYFAEDTTGVKCGELSKALDLRVYPNPFNPVVNIEFSLPEINNVSLRVYDIGGNLVRSIIEGKRLKAGEYKYRFDGSNLSSGVYFVRLEGNNFKLVKRVVLMK